MERQSVEVVVPSSCFADEETAVKANKHTPTPVKESGTRTLQKTAGNVNNKAVLEGKQETNSTNWNEGAATKKPVDVIYQGSGVAAVHEESGKKKYYVDEQLQEDIVEPQTSTNASSSAYHSNKEKMLAVMQGKRTFADGPSSRDEDQQREQIVVGDVAAHFEKSFQENGLTQIVFHQVTRGGMGQLQM
ncbi:unnamed protein product, partial [Amoebophrya sp. A25]|eukprot:GSA25T00002434001.1